MTTEATEKVRVVHLINHLGYGGTERQLFLVLQHFDRSRFEHRVVVFNSSPEKVYDEALAALGVEVFALPEDCRGVARRVWYLVRLMRGWHPQVVHSWTVHDNPYAGVAGRLAGVPVRWGSVRGSLHSEGLRRQRRWLQWLMLHGVERLVVNSLDLAEELAQAGVSRQRALLLPNCVLPQAKVPPADLRDFGIRPGDRLVGIVGNLRAVKNHGLFVRAMARLLPSRPNVRAVIVGQAIPSEPGYRAEIEAEIETLGLVDRIVLTGFRDDMPQIMECLSVLCLTSKSEGQPNAVLEAMMARRPVVACRVGGVPDLVEDGIHGLLIEPEDAEGLAAAVGRLLDRPDLAATMGEAGYQRAVSERGCEAAARSLAEAYLDALAR